MAASPFACNLFLLLHTPKVGFLWALFSDCVLLYALKLEHFSCVKRFLFSRRLVRGGHLAPFCFALVIIHKHICQLDTLVRLFCVP